MIPQGIVFNVLFTVFNNPKEMLFLQCGKSEAHFARLSSNFCSSKWTHGSHLVVKMMKGGGRGAQSPGYMSGNYERPINIFPKGLLMTKVHGMACCMHCFFMEYIRSQPFNTCYRTIEVI
jgi:hypothetical protein